MFLAHILACCATSTKTLFFPIIAYLSQDSNCLLLLDKFEDATWLDVDNVVTILENIAISYKQTEKQEIREGAGARSLTVQLA